MEKFIYIITTEYWYRDHIRMGGEYLDSKGYDVEIWRIISNRSIETNTKAEKYNKTNYYEISYKDLKKNIKKQDNPFFVFIYINDEIIKYIYLVAKKKFKYIILNSIGNYVFMKEDYSKKSACSTGNENTVRRVLNRLSTYGIKYFYQQLEFLFKTRKNKEIEKRLKKYPPIAYLKSTRLNRSNNPWMEAKDGIEIYTHSGDYDRYIECNRKNKVEEKCIVYLDSGLMSVSQDSKMGSSTPFNKVAISSRQDFFDRIEKVFIAFEKKYNTAVVICGHPHAEYEVGDFHNREIITDHTCELVQRSSIVISSAATSGSTNFALLYDKPIIVFGCDAYKCVAYGNKDNYFDVNDCLCNEILNIPFVNLDHLTDLEEIINFPRRADDIQRKEYIKKYIIDSNIIEETSIEYLCRYLKENGYLKRNI